MHNAESDTDLKLNKKCASEPVLTSSSNSKQEMQ